MPRLTPQQQIQNAQTWYHRNRENIMAAIAAADGVLRVAPWLCVGPKIIESLDRWDELLDSPQHLIECYYLRPLRQLRAVVEMEQD